MRKPHPLRTPTDRPERPQTSTRSRAAGRLSVVLLLLLSGCGALAQSLRNQECELDPVRPFDVVAVDPSQHEIRMFWRDGEKEPFLTLEAVRAHLEAQGDSVIALTNGGIYEPGFIPTGFYVEGGATLHPLNLSDGEGNFFLKPNGVFVVTDAGALVVESTRLETVQAPIRYATQSGPLLLSNGRVHPAFTRGSTNCRLRSGVGVTPDGQTYLAISNGALNFRSFARYFRDELGASDALYLDGSISALYAPHLGRTEVESGPFAIIIAIVARRAPR